MSTTTTINTTEKIFTTFLLFLFNDPQRRRRHRCISLKKVKEIENKNKIKFNEENKLIKKKSKCITCHTDSITTLLKMTEDSFNLFGNDYSIPPLRRRKVDPITPMDNMGKIRIITRNNPHPYPDLFEDVTAKEDEPDIY